jgi:hypothetical protein
LLGLLAGTGRAQQPQPPRSLDESATIEEAGEGKVLVKTAKSEAWWIQFGGETKVHVEGTAEPSYLRAGLTVKLTGEIDKKGALQEDIKELEVFTPQGKNALGFFADSSAEKPVRNVSAGSYEIRAKVTSYKDNEIQLAAGLKKISGKVAEGVAIKINVEDIKDVRNGDTAKIKATYYDPQKPYLQNPGVAVGEQVDIMLSKPLVGVKRKTPPKVAKPVKEKKEKKPAGETAEASPVAVDDLFGVDKPKEKGKDDKMDDETSTDERPKTKKPVKKPVKPDPDDASN